MTTKEAIQTMLDGYKLTSETWGVHAFIYFDGECFREENHTPIPLSDISGMSGILKIYEEPKPKQTVVIEKWLCYDNLAESYSICEESNIDGFINDDRGYISKVKLIDTYEVTL